MHICVISITPRSQWVMKLEPIHPEHVNCVAQCGLCSSDGLAPHI